MREKFFFCKNLLKKLRRTNYNTRDYYPQKTHFIVLRMVPDPTLGDLGSRYISKKKLQKNEGEIFFLQKFTEKTAQNKL